MNVETATKTTRKVRATKSKLVASAGGPGDTLPQGSVALGAAQVAPATASQVASEVTAAATPGDKASAEIRRLQGLLRETQGKLAAATADDTPPEPISDAALKPLMSEHIRTGASIGRWALTPEQKAQWKACKADRKRAINGRIYRKRVMGNVTRAVNEGALSRYRERVAEKSKRLLGITLGATFKAPKATKKE